MDIISVLVGAGVVILALAIYKDHKDGKARDAEHYKQVRRAIDLPKYRLKVTTTLGEVHYSNFFRVQHNPGLYSWIMTSKDCAESAADNAIKKGIRVAGRYLPACSIHDIQVESDENKNEETA